jgi:hypothetical protein
MAKHLYHIRFDKIKSEISKQKSKIAYNLKNKSLLELSKNLGNSFYDVAIYEFLDNFKIIQDQNYALQIYNTFKSKHFTEQLYIHLGLDMFDNDLDKQIVFYSFVYFLYQNQNDTNTTIKQKLFYHYFLHYITIVNKNTPTNINFKDMTLSYIKDKDIVLKESYKIDEDTKIVDFKLLINKQEIIKLQGKSIKTLRKQSYKKLFLYLIENSEEYTKKSKKMLSLEDVKEMWE